MTIDQAGTAPRPGRFLGWVVNSVRYGAQQSGNWVVTPARRKLALVGGWLPLRRRSGLVSEASSNWLTRFSDRRFSLVDAVSFEVMRRGNLPAAFAFDHHFEVAGFELLK
jgi:hypothetical protein